MKIVFIGLSSTYTEGMTYQENLLAQAAIKAGHDVVFISNPEEYRNGEIVETGNCDSVLESGMRLIRLPYVKIGFPDIYKKIRMFRGVYRSLKSIQPDIIYCHNHHYFSIVDIVKYKKEFSNVKIYVDTHVSENNSASNWMSKLFLHGIYYRYLLQRVIKYVEKYYYVGETEKIFSQTIYGVPEELMEYYPLGGIIFDEKMYVQKRNRKRKELGLTDDQLLLVHSGKMNKLKKTADLINAFKECKEMNARLVIIGMISSDIKDEVMELIQSDKRIIFLGWKKADELLEYLCACDLYCQPGSPSATMQNAICCKNVVLTFPQVDYTENIKYNCFLWCKDAEDMVEVFRMLSKNRGVLESMKKEAEKCATELLDYDMLLNRFAG